METTFSSLKDGSLNLEQVLFPERHLSDIHLDTLRVEVLDSGFYSLNEHAILKTSSPELIIVGARPSMGKSALMFQIAEQVANKNKPTLVFSLEMDNEQIARRLLSKRTGIPISIIASGKADKELLRKEQELMKKDPLYFIDKGGLGLHEIMQHSIDVNRRYGLGLIVIDYLQLIKKEKGHSTNDEIGAITCELKKLAKDLKVPIIVGSQLSRSNEYRGSHGGKYEPMLSDLRDSGNIEQDADIVLLMHRPSYYDINEDPEEAHIIIAKNRNGQTGTIKMKYCSAMTKFKDLVEDY